MKKMTYHSKRSFIVNSLLFLLLLSFRGCFHRVFNDGLVNDLSTKRLKALNTITQEIPEENQEKLAQLIPAGTQGGGDSLILLLDALEPAECTKVGQLLNILADELTQAQIKKVHNLLKLLSWEELLSLGGAILQEAESDSGSDMTEDGTGLIPNTLQKQKEKVKKVLEALDKIPVEDIEKIKKQLQGDLLKKILPEKEQSSTWRKWALKWVDYWLPAPMDISSLAKILPAEKIKTTMKKEATSSFLKEFIEKHPKMEPVFDKYNDYKPLFAELLCNTEENGKIAFVKTFLVYFDTGQDLSLAAAILAVYKDHPDIVKELCKNFELSSEGETALVQWGFSRNILYAKTLRDFKRELVATKKALKTSDH